MMNASETMERRREPESGIFVESNPSLAVSEAAVNVEEMPGSSESSAVQVITRYMCKYCGMQFVHRGDMDTHAVLHEDEKPPLTCGVCGKTYNTRSKLQRHVRVHSGERPFPCLICGKKFPRSDHVKQHMKVHMKLHGSKILSTFPTSQKSYCRLCGVKFEQKGDLQEHLLTHGYGKLISCTLCGEVYKSSEELKAHRMTHSVSDDSLPVLSIPHPTISSRASIPKRKKSTKVKLSGPARRKNKGKSNIGFAKFKISKTSGTWEAVGTIVKKEQGISDNTVIHCDEVMPVLEKMLNEGRHRAIGDEQNETESDSGIKDGSHEFPQMSISACYSLAEGQDNSDIPEIEEIRASTLTDGSNMIVIPTSSESPDDGENASAQSYTPVSDMEGEDDVEISQNGSVRGDQDLSLSAKLSAQQSSQSTEQQAATQTTQVMSIKPSTHATATSASIALQQVFPQTAGNAISTTTTRPTISLLPNVLAFRTHPVLATSMQLQPHSSGAVSASMNSVSSMSNPVTSLSSTRHLAGLSSMESFPAGRKMMRCHHCYIWFEDSALGLLHQSLHSADETDPFTCKKCLKRLGNRLEFTAHIVWHLDPMMEEAGVI